MNEFNVGELKVIEITKGIYNTYYRGALAHEGLHSKTPYFNDEVSEVVRQIKELEKIDKIARLNNSPIDINSIKVPYPCRLHQSLINKIQSLKMSNGINITSFINEAIAEKLEKEGLL